MLPLVQEYRGYVAKMPWGDDRDRERILIGFDQDIEQARAVLGKEVK